MGWYLGVIGRLYNEKCLIYIFTVEVQDVTPKTFTNENYNGWFQQLKYQFSPVLVNNTYDNTHFSNQGKEKIP